MHRTKPFHPVFAILFASIPGLTVWLFGKRRCAASIVLAFLFAVVLLVVFPSMAAWYILSGIYIGQMVYSAGLSILQLPVSEKPKIVPDARLAVPLPERWKKTRQIDQEVLSALSRASGPDSRLISAILALEPSTSQYKYFGVTENHLIMADCTFSGNVANISYRDKNEVAWVNLEIGKHICQMTIRFEEEQTPSLTLQIPGKLQKSAIAFLKEFPGIWEPYGADYAHDYYRRADRKFKNTLEYTLNYVLTGAICFGLIILSFRLPGQDPIGALLKILPLAAACYIFGWPGFIEFLQEIKKETAITLIGILRCVLMVPIVILAWGCGVILLGMQVVHTLQALR